jgi:hypothetical protein
VPSVPFAEVLEAVSVTMMEVVMEEKEGGVVVDPKRRAR